MFGRWTDRGRLSSNGEINIIELCRRTIFVAIIVLSLFSHCRFKVVNDEVSDFNTIVNVYIVAAAHIFYAINNDFNLDFFCRDRVKVRK